MSDDRCGWSRRRAPRVAAGLAATALALAAAGCGSESAAPETPAGPAGGGGLTLPPGFKTVDLPDAKRQEIFKDAFFVRALAVQKANRDLPMDNAHLPQLDLKANKEEIAAHKAKFDKRVAEHKVIVDGYLEKDLAALVERHKISKDDLARIEEEASRLRWTPPADPKLESEDEAKPKASPAPKAGAEAAAGPAQAAPPK